MYTLLQFSLLVFTICTKILFLPYLYVVVGQVPGSFDLWHYCMQAFAKSGHVGGGCGVRKQPCVV